MKILMIIGVPGTGKSAIINDFIRRHSWIFCKPKYVPYHFCQELNCSVLGDYCDMYQQYPGTDRMSMAAQPHVLKWLKTYLGKSVIFEGDRLGNGSMIRSLLEQNYELKILRLWTPPDELAKRRNAERSNQTKKFWQRCATKINNILEEHGSIIESVDNCTPKDLKRISKQIEEFVK